MLKLLVSLGFFLGVLHAAGPQGTVRPATPKPTLNLNSKLPAWGSVPSPVSNEPKNIIGNPPTAAPVVPPPSGPGGVPQPTSTFIADPVEAIEADKQRANQAALQMNAMNPMSTAFDANALISPQVGEKLKQFQALMNNPVVSFSMKLASNPEFVPGVQALMEHKNKKLFLYCEIGLTLFFLFFRAWRGMKEAGILKRVFFNIWSTAVYFVILAWVMPMFVFGETYTKLAHQVVSALKEEIKKQQELPAVASSPEPSPQPAFSSKVESDPQKH